MEDIVEDMVTIKNILKNIDNILSDDKLAMIKSSDTGRFYYIYMVTFDINWRTTSFCIYHHKYLGLKHVMMQDRFLDSLCIT